MNSLTLDHMEGNPTRRRMGRRCLMLLLAVWSGLTVTVASGFEFRGTKTITTISADGARTIVGSIQFTSQPSGATVYKISWNAAAFTDYFLSMREFKCLPANAEITCHVPYPHQTPQTVSAEHLEWLEHSLLFFYKRPAEFGAKLWNGVYFELKREGNALVGTPKAIDLNAIAAPPTNKTEAPLNAGLRDEMPTGARWIRTIRID